MRMFRKKSEELAEIRRLSSEVEALRKDVQRLLEGGRKGEEAASPEGRKKEADTFASRLNRCYFNGSDDGN